MKESIRYTPITETKNIFSITSDSKANVTFAKGSNPKFTNCDSVHICREGKTTESYTKGTVQVKIKI